MKMRNCRSSQPLSLSRNTPCLFLLKLLKLCVPFPILELQVVMVFAPQAIMSANSLFFVNNIRLWSHPCKSSKGSLHLSSIRASSGDDPDCNVEECAPDKEVGKVSMEWLAGEKTKVVGTFPPRNRGWTGYVEKDTAGQTNIYSIEPTVYVAESAISSGTAGSSADGVENTVAITAGIALITIAAASSLLLLLSKNTPPQIQTVEYSGPSLTYYINKFKPQETVEASVSTEPATAVAVQAEATVPEVTSVQVKSGYQIEYATPPAPGVSVGN